MDINLKGKVTVITGAAANGLGRADAEQIGLSGSKIAIIDIADCSETIAYLKKQNIEAKSYKCDVSNFEEVQKTIQNIITDFNKIDVLINNASILTTVGMFADIPVEKWNRDISVNLIGSANVTRAVWPHLIKNNWGRVIFMSSIAGTLGGAGQSSYAATKAGVIGLAKSLALEGARFNITVNCIAPGVIASEAVKSFIRDDMLKRMEKRSAMRRLGKTSEIANAITFLASEQASFITGEVLTVDGGSSLFTF